MVDNVRGQASLFCKSIWGLNEFTRPLICSHFHLPGHMEDYDDEGSSGGEVSDDPAAARTRPRPLSPLLSQQSTASDTKPVDPFQPRSSLAGQEDQDDDEDDETNSQTSVDYAEGGGDGEEENDPSEVADRKWSDERYRARAAHIEAMSTGSGSGSGGAKVAAKHATDEQRRRALDRKDAKPSAERPTLPVLSASDSGVAYAGIQDATSLAVFLERLSREHAVPTDLSNETIASATLVAVVAARAFPLILRGLCPDAEWSSGVSDPLREPSALSQSSIRSLCLVLARMVFMAWSDPARTQLTAPVSVSSADGHARVFLPVAGPDGRELVFASLPFDDDRWAFPDGRHGMLAALRPFRAPSEDGNCGPFLEQLTSMCHVVLAAALTTVLGQCPPRHVMGAALRLHLGRALCSAAEAKARASAAEAKAYDKEFAAILRSKQALLTERPSARVFASRMRGHVRSLQDRCQALLRARRDAVFLLAAVAECSRVLQSPSDDSPLRGQKLAGVAVQHLERFLGTDSSLSVESPLDRCRAYYARMLRWTLAANSAAVAVLASLSVECFATRSAGEVGAVFHRFQWKGALAFLETQMPKGHAAISRRSIATRVLLFGVPDSALVTGAMPAATTTNASLLTLDTFPYGIAVHDVFLTSRGLTVVQVYRRFVARASLSGDTKAAAATPARERTTWVVSHARAKAATANDWSTNPFTHNPMAKNDDSEVLFIDRKCAFQTVGDAASKFPGAFLDQSTADRVVDFRTRSSLARRASRALVALAADAKFVNDVAETAALCHLGDTRPSSVSAAIVDEYPDERLVEVYYAVMRLRAQDATVVSARDLADVLNMAPPPPPSSLQVPSAATASSTDEKISAGKRASSSTHVQEKHARVSAEDAHDDAQLHALFETRSTRMGGFAYVSVAEWLGRSPRGSLFPFDPFRTVSLSGFFGNPTRLSQFRDELPRYSYLFAVGRHLFAKRISSLPLLADYVSKTVVLADAARRDELSARRERMSKALTSQKVTASAVAFYEAAVDGLNKCHALWSPSMQKAWNDLKFHPRSAVAVHVFMEHGVVDHGPGDSAVLDAASLYPRAPAATASGDTKQPGQRVRQLAGQMVHGFVAPVGSKRQREPPKSATPTPATSSNITGSSAGLPALPAPATVTSPKRPKV